MNKLAVAFMLIASICLTSRSFAQSTPGEETTCKSGQVKIYAAYQIQDSKIKDGIFTKEKETTTGFGAMYLCGPATSFMNSHMTSDGLKGLIGAVKSITKITPVIVNVIQLETTP